MANDDKIRIFMKIVFTFNCNLNIAMLFINCTVGDWFNAIFVIMSSLIINLIIIY